MSNITANGIEQVNDRIAAVNKRIEGLTFDMGATKAELVAQGYKVTRLKPGKRPKDYAPFLPSAGKKTRRHSGENDRTAKNWSKGKSGEVLAFDPDPIFGGAGGWHATSGRKDDRAESSRERAFERSSLGGWYALKASVPSAGEGAPKPPARFTRAMRRLIEGAGLEVPE